MKCHVYIVITVLRVLEVVSVEASRQLAKQRRLIAACQNAAAHGAPAAGGEGASPSHICRDPVDILLSGHSLQKKCQSAFSRYRYRALWTQAVDLSEMLNYVSPLRCRSKGK